ncbi:hypothetical protein UVI_02018280 [Ustilaginoidea virens]|uniref:Glycoside hydrolase family 43 protein n=1 Tax=Ustilaginoidea virens TaxID=1159556 RepID=A0A1B5KS85_USTVR|nr:hypothetical protein UVI_02018280 [Ustilaginoidea virens]
MRSKNLFKAALLSSAVSGGVCSSTDGPADNLGLANGSLKFTTAHFQVELVRDAQVLVSLKLADGSFDFLPRDVLSHRTGNGQYHWGDVTYRYRETGSKLWIDGDSAASRKPVKNLLRGNRGDLTGAELGPSLPSSPLRITRQWSDLSGDLGLTFAIRNHGKKDVELGSLGFPAEFNSIFTGRSAQNMLSTCSLADPYIGMNAGHLRVTPISGTGPALVVTPIGDTPMTAYRNLIEPFFNDTAYGSRTFEGFYEWQVLTKAWAENEWKGAEPWNEPTARVLKPGSSYTFGLRFSLAAGGVRDMDRAVRDSGTPIALGIPGYIIPQGEPAQLVLNAPSDVDYTFTAPGNAVTVTQVKPGTYQVTPRANTFGRVRLTIRYKDGKYQTVHYFVTKAGSTAVADMGKFLTTNAWFKDTSDPFGRAPSFMTYDYVEKKIVLQEERPWIAGLSDEGGVGAYLAVAAKQAIQPNADEIEKLEEFVAQVVIKKIQTEAHAVRKSLFFYEPSQVPGYTYRKDINWDSWSTWNKAEAYSTKRAYNYVHVAALYWSLYRAGRAYPTVLRQQNWNWYLEQAYLTTIRSMQSDVDFNRLGLMGETVFGEILKDLSREGFSEKATKLNESMQSRANQWNAESVPFGVDKLWDSAHQEGVYYWSSYAGKMPRIERQIHHYASALNSLVLLSAFRDNSSDTYLLRAGYGGVSGPVSSIHQDGYVAGSFHSHPDTLQWDGITGDYGPGFLGMALGIGTFIVDDKTWGRLVFGGVAQEKDGEVTVRTTDPVRRRVYVGPLNLQLEIDAGIIQSVIYGTSKRSLKLVLTQIPEAASTNEAVLWVSGNWALAGPDAVRRRGGWVVNLEDPPKAPGSNNAGSNNAESKMASQASGGKVHVVELKPQ